MNNIPEITFLSTLEDDGFEIQKLSDLLGKLDLKEHYICRPHRIKFYNIIYITNGEDFHFIDFKKYPITKGTLIFLNKNQVHKFSQNTNYEGYIILFTDKFLNRNLINIQNLFYDILSKPTIFNNCLEEFETIFKQLFFEYNSQSDIYKEKVFSLLFNYLIIKSENLLNEKKLKANNNKYLLLFKEFTDNLNENFHQSRNVNFYAQNLNISSKHLNMICQKFLNKSAKNTIDDFIILEAKKELISNIPIKKISYKLGFDEVTNFVKYFKKRTNISPSKFKEKNSI